jgi:2-iminobutanoate/2-iminopropanoate deaminase
MSTPEKQIVYTENAPKPIGPYSQGIRAGNLFFSAGQLGIEPATGELAPGGIEAETRQVFTNLEHVLAAAGSSLSRVVKTTVFMRDLSEFGRMNAIYAEFFSQNPPARTTVQAVLPKAGAAVEIEVIALVD